MAGKRMLAVLAPLTIIALLTPSSSAFCSATTSSDHCFIVEQLGPSLTQPVALGYPTGDTNNIWIADKYGTLNVYSTATGADVVVPILDLDTAGSAFINPGSMGDERGFLGLAFHPTDASRLFTHYSSSSGGHHSVVSEWVINDPTGTPSVNTSSELSILELDQPEGNHNGGFIGFDESGMLMIAFGDGGSANDPLEAGQDFNTLLGAIVRIDVQNRGDGYAIPSDNPFADGVEALPEIYANGLRNPFRCSFSTVDGSEVFSCGDVGQATWEEATVIEAGDNLGWRFLEGHCIRPNDLDTPSCLGDEFKMPFVSYFHANSAVQSIIGGYFVPESRYPANLHGKYIFGDYGSAELHFATPDDPSAVPGFGDYTIEPICQTANLAAFNDNDDLLSFALDQNDNIYVLKAAGVFRLNPTAGACDSTTYAGLCCHSFPYDNKPACDSDETPPGFCSVTSDDDGASNLASMPSAILVSVMFVFSLFLFY